MKKYNEKNNKNKKDEWEGCDDCAICWAMKNGEANNMEGLMKAFKEAEMTGTGMVGFGDVQKNRAPIMTMRTANKDDLYYDAMEALEEKNFKIAERLLTEAQNLDKDYVQTYVGFANLYGLSKNKEKARENIQMAFKKTLEKFPKWPKEMSWLDLDNRAYLRAIQWKADLFLDDKERKKAIELYKLLLKLNPNDNQGVRFILKDLIKNNL